MAEKVELQIVPFVEDLGKKEGSSMQQTKKKKENQKKTQKKATKRKKNDDESEQNPRKKKANITSKVVRKPDQSPDKMYSSLNIRTSPKNFKAVTGNLKPNQIKWVKEIGLGSILDMKIDTIPSKVAFYVVDNLDINRKAIKTSNGYIKINEDSVTEIFGLKNEGDDIYEIEAGEDADEIKTQWNKQFDNPKMIRQKHIVNLITKSNSVDINFKVNFIILFMNTMINTTKMGICSTNFVSSIGSNFDFKRINWCKYMYDNAMASKFTWESSSTVDFYTGPITFLTLMYLNSTKCLEVSHRRIKPAILEWTSEKMRQREKFEIENSGFGKLDMNTDEVHDALIPERQKTPQEFLANLNQDMDELLIIKAEIEFQMTKAMMLYPKDEGLKEFKAGYEDMFKMNENMIVEVVRPHEESSKEIRLEKEEANQNIHNSSEATIVIDNVLKNINIEELFTEEKETRSEKLGENEDKREEEREVEEKKKQDEEEQKLKALEEKRTEKEENEKKAEEIKTIEETEEHNKSQELKTPQESQKTDVSEETPASCPTFKLGIEGVDTPKPAKKDKSKKGDLVVRLTKKQKLEEKDKDEPQEREKRTEKIGELLKSPYKQRSVDVRSGLYAIEKKIGDWIFSFHGEKLLLVFETASRKSSFKVIFESMIKDSEAYSNVIDNWAELLNHEERLKSSDSPSRLFCTTDVLGDDVFNEDFDWRTYSDTFKENIKEKVIDDLQKIKKFEMVFFPIIRSVHFYLICYDLKNGRAHLLDNSATNVPFQAKYGNVPKTLHKLFINFLKGINDSRYNKINNVQPKREVFKWRTKDNHKDCSIFVMRHMETFMGGPIKNWDCGFATEEEDKKKQLEKLRFKYVTKILLSDINLKRQWVLDQANEYALKPKEEKDEDKRLAQLNKEDRLNDPFL